jgi:hypothetical protein
VETWSSPIVYKESKQDTARDADSIGDISTAPYTQTVKMTSVAVSKSSPAVITAPPEPATMTSSGTIELTPLDSVFVKFPFTALLVFEHLSHEAHEVMTTGSIKKALSQALAHYHPFAGRISSEADGDGFSIRCTGEGAEFIAAAADCSLKEAKILDTSSSNTKILLLDELIVQYPFGSYGSDDPLLSVQVTEFSCGGLVIGVTWSHAVADGAGIAQFLAAVGELARGPSPSVVPARWDDAVSSHLPLPDPILQVMLACPESRDMELLVPLDVTVPSSLIDRVKAESCGHFDGRPCTVFEVVLAVLWWCRVRATMASRPGAPVCLTFAVNMRKHVGAKEGYYGNCIANQLLATATSAAVASAGIMDLIKMIKRAKDQLPGKLKEKVSGGDDDDGQLMRGLGGRYDMLHVSSWRNIGFEQVDFGSGPPARVMFYGRGGAPPPPVPTCVMYPPCKGQDGVNVLSISTREEHAGTFLEELANLA